MTVYRTSQTTNPIDTTPGGGSHYENDVRDAYSSGNYSTGDVIGADSSGITIVTDTGYRYIPGATYAQTPTTTTSSSSTTRSSSRSSSRSSTRTPTPVKRPAPEPFAKAAPTPPDIVSKPKPFKEDLIDMQKYEYVTGLYQMAASQVGYKRTGIYVSKPFIVPGNVLEVELEAQESHPLFDLVSYTTNRCTSVEYYITHKARPIATDWLPILPKGHQNIYNELLQVTNQRVGELRFKAKSDMPIYVYCNHKLMANHEWSIYPDYQQIIVNSEQFVASHIYTIDYTPDSEDYNPWLLDLREHGLSPSTAIESSVEGPDRNGTLYLQRYPYIDYNRVQDQDYHPIRVYIDDANIIGPEGNEFNSALPWHDDTLIATRNITDYQNLIRPELTPYQTTDPVYLTFEYTHHQNMLYFAETFDRIEPSSGNHATGNFRIEYDVLDPTIRFKIIMRNTNPMLSTTPIVDNYTLSFHIVR